MNLKALEGRIAESGKLVENSKQNAERLEKESKIPRILPDAGKVIKYHDRNKGRGQGSDVQMKWKEEDEEDRSSPCFDSAQHDLKILFLKDHDEVQLEQFELENSLVPLLLQKPGNKVQNPAYRRFGILLVLILIMGMYSAKASAQSPAGLQIGDQVPDITISSIINYKTGTAKLSDFKGKLLVFNFWSTTCLASVALLPHLVKLQKAFPDKLQIIAVGKEGLATTKVVASAKELSGLAFMPADSHLVGMFPHELVPQLVWINAESKVLGITTDYDATEATVQKIINQGKVVFKDPKADQIGFDSDKPLFLNDNGKAGTYLYRSILTAYSNGLPEVLGIKRDSSQFRIYSVNQGRLQLYFMALQLPRYSWPNSRIVYQGVDTAKFMIKNLVEEKWDKTFCYELSLPSYFEDRAHAIMLHDLQKLFGATAALEKRTRPCYVLSAIPGKLKLATKGGKPGNNFQSADSREKLMINSQLVELIAYLQEIPGYLPVLDETGYRQPLDLKLNNNLKDIASLNKSLSRYGLQMQKAERPIEMLVISEIDIPAPLSLAK